MLGVVFLFISRVWTEKPHFPKYKKLFRFFFSLNIKIWGEFPFPKVSENIRNHLILEPESSISRNIRIFFGDGFFCFLSLDVRSAPASPILYF